MLTNLEKHEYMKGLRFNRQSNKGRKSFGVGTNDVDYPVARKCPDGGRVICPAYQCWYSIMTRVFSKSFQTSFPTYTGVTIDQDWLTLSNFTEWWVLNQVDGWELDKDILSDNKLYSKDTCIFIPDWLNKITISSSRSRGDCPVGVSMWKGRFQTKIRNRGRIEHLGLFDNREEAYQAWKNRKLELLKERKYEMDEIDIRIYPRTVEIIERTL